LMHPYNKVLNLENDKTLLIALSVTKSFKNQ
jgi:hypothetical protein